MLNLIGQRFGKLVVEGISPKQTPNYVKIWSCKCDCGNTSEVRTDSLKMGRTSSCGCATRMLLAQTHTTHGSSHTPEYEIWTSMRQRCFNPNSQAYPYYGARGITVCKRWKSFKNFLADMGLRPSPEHSIDRYPNNDGNYEPGNCRWATRTEQANNVRSNLRHVVGGETLTHAAAARKAGVHATTLSRRLARGLSIEEAVAGKDCRKQQE